MIRASLSDELVSYGCGLFCGFVGAVILIVVLLGRATG